MRLNKSHVGKLFDIAGDGSWVYQLVAVSRTHLLFYDFHGGYVKEEVGKYDDWQHFKPAKPWPKRWTEYGWTSAEEN